MGIALAMGRLLWIRPELKTGNPPFIISLKLPS